MLALKTPRHRTFVTVPELTGGGREEDAYGELVDAAIDRLYALCCEDPGLLTDLDGLQLRKEAYQRIAVHLERAVGGQAWLRRIAGADMCRRVLYLLRPNQFGFDRHGWIH